MSGTERGNRDYFFCYNKRVSDYMFKHGINYITVAIDRVDGRTFSLFEITPRFQELLKQYKEEKLKRIASGN